MTAEQSPKGAAESPVRLGELLIRKGLIDSQQLEEALQKQRSNREFLGTILVEKGYITEEQLLSVLSEQFRMLRFNLTKDYYIDWNLVMKFSTGLIQENKCFPLRQDRRSIIFGITNPLNALGMSKATEEARGEKVEFVLVLESEMQEALERYRYHVNVRIRNMLDEGK